MTKLTKLTKLTKFMQLKSQLITISDDAKISVNDSGSKLMPWWFSDSFVVGVNPTGST